VTYETALKLKHNDPTKVADLIMHKIKSRMVVMQDLNICCPECKNVLINNGNKLICGSCGKECIVDGKIYDFLGDSNYYWSEIPLEEMRIILDIATKRGWENAIQNICLNHPKLKGYLTSNARTDWLFHCIDYSHNSACLDIGSGFGGNTFALAKYYDEVWSLEAVKQRITFQKIRQEQENIDNIKFVRTDWLHLPFPDNYFDIVASNGCLEWVGLSDYSKDPRSLQIAFLKEIKRVLKPNGCLYVGVENRFALNAFMGSRDHSGLPFTSVLPRKLADFMVRFSQKSGEYGQHNVMSKWKDYRTYTYSMAGYEKLLREANYSDTNYYWCFSYNLPTVSGRFYDESFPYYLKMSKNTSASTFNSLIRDIGSYFPKTLLKFINQRLCDSFLIYAYKENKPNTFESNLLNKSDPNFGFLQISDTKNEDAKINYYILNGIRLQSVIKFPRNRKSA